MKVRCFIIVFIIVIFSSCLEEEYQLAPPQLRIYVKDDNGEYVNEATVKLYSSSNDFRNEYEPIDFGLTDTSGSIVFIELEESIYYFKIEKNGKSNLKSNYTFKKPLKSGERKVITTSIL